MLDRVTAESASRAGWWVRAVWTDQQWCGITTVQPTGFRAGATRNRESLTR